MEFSYKVVNKDKQTRARAGLIETPHGVIQTPAYSPVATKATVKALDVPDLKAAGAQVVLANTYHLYLRPGPEILETFGGFAPFMKWDGPTITDSGGYQVSFLRTPPIKGINGEEPEEPLGGVIKISDEGALFRSYIDGSEHLLTPEKSMAVQKSIGADIIMAFDQPLGLDYSEKKKKEAFDRTFRWEERSFIAWEKQEKERKSGSFQALFGIVQGGEDSNLTRKCLEFLLGLNFPGLAIGGEAVGVDPAKTARSLDGIADLLPDDKPLHALGLGGGPEGIFEAVERGADLFDNTSITRQARNGILFLYPEEGGTCENKFRLDITKKIYRDDKDPISKICQCHTCQNYSKAYIHHLLMARELLGFRLASIHNVTFIHDLMTQIREAIKNNDFGALKKEWLG